VTEYDVLWSKEGYSFVMCVLLTGRTHQIRVHMRAIGCPLAGDTLYSQKNSAVPAFVGPRVFLHSWRLSFVHPRTGEGLSFKAPIPEDLKGFLRALRRKKTENIG
jgi:23S rRNA pseudouridine1911/1915/1917 synthase